MRWISTQEIRFSTDSVAEEESIVHRQGTKHDALNLYLFLASPRKGIRLALTSRGRSSFSLLYC